MTQPLALLTFVVVLVLASIGPAPAVPSPASSGLDYRISHQQCDLLGRAWSRGACSRTTCARSADRMSGGRNAEVCVHGRGRHPYGQPVEFRTCAALHRHWIAAVNWCASDPFRGHGLDEDSPWCRAPYTVYVDHDEVEGAYDECLRPHAMRKDLRLAQQEGITVGEVALNHSQVLCAERPATQYVDGRCVAAAPGTPPPAGGEILSIGDSIGWRSDDELARLRPGWTLDALPGRPIGDLAGRVAYDQSLLGPPAGLVVALGTNPTDGYTEADLDNVVNALPEQTQVLFVLPYRANASAQVLLDHYGDWMRRLAAQRPHTCLADWRDEAAGNPHLLVDGVHPTQAGEAAWADLVSVDWDVCPTS